MTDIRIGSALTENGNPIAAHGKRSVREALLRQFVEKIVSGEFPENATLPNEAELTQQLGVSRTSLRETMQYLSALGMIRSRTRAGTTVLPRENWNYLDPLVLDAVLVVDARLVAVAVAAVVGEDTVTLREAES